MKHSAAALEETFSTASSLRSDLRAHNRLAVSGRIVLVWKDGTRIRSTHGLAKNVSQGGALVQSFRALPVGTFVRLRSKTLYFMSGCAKVQHCARRGLLYHIGLKFYSDLSARF